MIQVVVGILKKQDKLLICERPPDKPYAGFWEFPGGKVEANESSEAALKRELHEELGIIVQSSQFWFDHRYTYPDKMVLLEIWKIEQYSGDVIGKENQLLKWVTVDEMERLRLLEGNFPILKKIKELS